MQVINSTQFRKNFFQILKTSTLNHEPITVTGKEIDAVIISKTDYTSIMETIFLMSNKQSWSAIIKAINEPWEECTPEENIEW